MAPFLQVKAPGMGGDAVAAGSSEDWKRVSTWGDEGQNFQLRLSWP